jgi:hypothetical protein
MKKRFFSCTWLAVMLGLIYIFVACGQEEPSSIATPDETVLAPKEVTAVLADPTLVTTQTADPTVTSEPTPAPTRPADPPPTPKPVEPETYSAQVSSYSLGNGIILQEQFPEDSRFREMPVRLEGVIGVPEEEGTYPIVLILHGSHFFCPNEEIWPCPIEDEQPNYAGFTYLVEALAEAGYVALSINVNAENTFAFGESPASVRTTQLIDLHLQELMAANAGGSDKLGLDLNGRIDPSRMVWMGHSRGADLANWITRDHNLDQAASDSGYGPVQGLLLIAPPVVFLDALPVVDLPTALILPTCDADVIGLDGQKFYESARFDPDRTHYLTSVYLQQGNHNNFNTVLTPDVIIDDRPDCVKGMVLTAPDQQAFLAAYAVDFLRTIYGTPAEISQVGQTLGLDPSLALPDALYGLPVQVTTLQPAAGRLTLMQPQSEAELSQNLLGGHVTRNGVTVLFCPEGYYVPAVEPGSEPCKRVNFNQPAFPQQLLVNWETIGAEWRTAVPESHTDLTGYTAVQLRVAIDPLSELNPAGEPQSFTVELVDGDGNRAQTVAPQVAYPVGITQPNDFFEGDYFTGQVPMHMIHIPLMGFSSVDLANITEVALIFDQTLGGTLFLADLEFIKPGLD